MALLNDYRLTDWYLKDQGTSFLTGIQALARVPTLGALLDPSVWLAPGEL